MTIQRVSIEILLKCIEDLEKPFLPEEELKRVWQLIAAVIRTNFGANGDHLNLMILYGKRLPDFQEQLLEFAILYTSDIAKNVQIID